MALIERIERLLRGRTFPTTNPIEEALSEAAEMLDRVSTLIRRGRADVGWDAKEWSEAQSKWLAKLRGTPERESE